MTDPEPVPMTVQEFVDANKRPGIHHRIDEC
jgi:hypothetical protein